MAEVSEENEEEMKEIEAVVKRIKIESKKGKERS